MVRASHGVSSGEWYFELQVNSAESQGLPSTLPPASSGAAVPLPLSAHTRVGWSTEKGDLEVPVGFDRYSYGYRDLNGTKFHQSMPAAYGEPYGMTSL
jgi:Set1/Ash2 histone methyltransferase complex subunit ASH2